MSDELLIPFNDEQCGALISMLSFAAGNADNAGNAGNADNAGNSTTKLTFEHMCVWRGKFTVATRGWCTCTTR